MSVYVPEQGHIIWLDFDPSSGSEIMKRRPAIVITKKIFNAHTGFAFVAPITSTERGNKFELKLPKQCKTQGSILLYQLKSVDFKARQAKKIELCPKASLEQVLSIARVILS
ncbi:MAG: type II toxin-antitoxin system PemK/MazF family toxin [Francisellaceae bacterium]